MLEVLYHRAKFGGARISPAAGVAKNVAFVFLSVCLSVCLFVRHTFERHSLCARWVCYSPPYLALIGKRGSVQ